MRCVLPKRKGVTKGKMDTSYHPYWVGGYGIMKCASVTKKKIRGSGPFTLLQPSPNMNMYHTPISHQKKESLSFLYTIYVH